MVLPPVTDEQTKRMHVDPDNARKVYELDSLIGSIQKDGVLQPVGLWADADRDCLFVLWGNRRVLSAQKLGLETIPARVFPNPLSPKDKGRFQLVENLQRIDLRPSEEANAYRGLIAEGMTARDVAQMLSVTDVKVSRKLALLKLAAPILAMVDSRQLSESAGWELSHLDEAAQLDLAANFGDGLNREDVAALVRKAKGKKPGRSKPPRQSFRLGNVSITVSAGKQPLSWDALLPAFRKLADTAQELKKAGADVSALGNTLKAS